MKALRFQQFGLENLRLEDVPKPRPGAGEVLVRVMAASINPSDWKNVQGMMREQTTLPRIPGRDFAGVVEQGSENCINQEVWGCGGGDLGFTHDGSHAEYVVVPESAISPKPRNLSCAQAAAAGLGVVTAWTGLLDRAGLRKGETLLVTGANGTVGSAAVQLGAWAGARVIGIDRSAENQSGADVMLNPESPSFAHELKDAVGQGVNVVFDAVGGPLFPVALNTLARGGRMVVITVQNKTPAEIDLLNFYRNDLRLIGLNTLNLSAQDAGASLQEATRPFELEWLRPRELETRPFVSGSKAYLEAMEGRGKFVLLFG
jgi:NADPH:quinone reductase-like Zn-dependent oxidoreductase